MLTLAALAATCGAAQPGHHDALGQDAQDSIPVFIPESEFARAAAPRDAWPESALRQQPSNALPSIGGIVSVGLNVEISRLNGALGSTFIPPDTMAAVGPNHIVEMINGNFEIIDKTTGTSIQSMTLDAFWTNVAGLGIINNGRFDPRILFDPPSGRWFAVSIDNVIDNVPPGGDNINEAANNVFIARSDTDDPTGDWDGVSFNADSVGVLEFHDYPTLGLDADGLYICTQDFDGGGNESCYSVPKADLLLAAPTVANLTRFEATPAGLPAVSGSWQAAVNRGLSLGRAPLLGSTGTALRRTNIFGAAAAGATLDTAVAITGDPGHAAPPAARQPQDSDNGDTEDLENVAPRFVGNVIVVGGSLWAVHAVAGNAPAPGNSALRWYEINEATNTIIQTGLIEDANIDYHEPSIAVNEFGHVVIGYTCSGRNLPASVCASVGVTAAGVTTFQPPAVLFAGSGTYFRDFGTNRNRWGDYSAVVVDPADPATFWVFQEYTAQDAGNVDVGPGEAQGGLWGIRAVELTFDELTGGDLVVQKNCQPAANLFTGQTAFCEISVTNFGPDAMLNVELTDRYLSSGTFNLSGITTTKGSCSATPNPQVNTGTVNCNLGRLAENENVLVHVNVDAQTAQTINDTARVTSDSDDFNPGDNQASGTLVFQGAADLAITKSDSPDPVIAGTNITYTINITNNGPAAATNVVVSDLLPTTLSVVSVTGSTGATCNAGIPGSVPTTCNFGTLGALANRSMTIIAKVDPSLPAGTVLLNNASVSSDTADNNNANNLAATSTVVDTRADLRLSKGVQQALPIAGGSLAFTLNVTNLGPSWARSVIVTDTLPPNVTFVSASGDGVCASLGGSPEMVTCMLGDIENNGVRDITLQTQVASSVPDGTTLINTASVSSITTDPNLSNNQSSAQTTAIAQADIWVDTTAVQLTGNPSRTIRYTLAVYNKPGCEADDALSCGAGGPSDAQNVVVTDTLPLDAQKLNVVFVSQNCTYNQALHNVVCNVPVGHTLPAGQFATFIIDVQVAGSVGDFTNNVSVATSTDDPNMTNNTDQVRMIVKGGSKRPAK